MVKHAASKNTQKACQQTPRFQALERDAQPQDSSSAGRPTRNTLATNATLDDCIQNSREIAAAEAADQPQDTVMQQAGPSRPSRKGKAALTPQELEVIEKAEYEKGLNYRIERYGQKSAVVQAYRWAYRHRQTEAKYTSSADSERGHDNTDADAEFAAILQAEETDNSHRQAEQVDADRQAAEQLQTQLQGAVSQQLIADRLYAETLEKQSRLQTRAAARQAAAAAQNSAETRDSEAEPVQEQESPTEAALRAKISELQANPDHERSLKRTAKVIDPQFPSLAEANAIAEDLYDDFGADVQQAGLPIAHQARKMGSLQAGPSRIDRLATSHEPAAAVPQAQPNIRQNFMNMHNVGRPPVRSFPAGAPNMAPLRMHTAVNRTAAAAGPQAHASHAAAQPAAHAPMPPAVPAPQAVPAVPQAFAPAPHAAHTHAAHAPATAGAYNPFAPAPYAAAMPAQATAAVHAGNSREPDPDQYYHKSFQQLTTAEKKQVKKNLNDSIYMTYDEYSKDQDCTPESWLHHLEIGLRNNTVNPDHAVRFFRDQHLGNVTARSLASWVTADPEATWDDFKQSFLSRNPGKPPQVTRASWKAISMRTCGTYHAYLQEFNRQKALISTSADEVVEQFLSGLTVQLKGQVESLKTGTGRLMSLMNLSKPQQKE